MCDNLPPSTFQPNPHNVELKTRRSFADLAHENETRYECQRKPESGIGDRENSAEDETKVHVIRQVGQSMFKIRI